MVEALSELPDLMREVVVLKHCQGWTLPQIADGSAVASRPSPHSCAGGSRDCESGKARAQVNLVVVARSCAVQYSRIS